MTDGRLTGDVGSRPGEKPRDMGWGHVDEDELGPVAVGCRSQDWKGLGVGGGNLWDGDEAQVIGALAACGWGQVRLPPPVSPHSWGESVQMGDHLALASPQPPAVCQRRSLTLRGFLLLLLFFNIKHVFKYSLILIYLKGRGRESPSVHFWLRVSGGWWGPKDSGYDPCCRPGQGLLPGSDTGSLTRRTTIASPALSR